MIHKYDVPCFILSVLLFPFIKVIFVSSLQDSAQGEVVVEEDLEDEAEEIAVEEEDFEEAEVVLVSRILKQFYFPSVYAFLYGWMVQFDFA